MQPTPLAAWVRGIAVFSPHPGSRRSRGVTFWRLRAAEFFGREVSVAEMRRALVAAGVRIGNDGEITNMLARESMMRAARTFPERYVLDPVTGWVGVRQ